MQPQLMMKNNDSRGMKVLLLLLVLILATIASFAQGGYTRPNTNYGTRMYRLGVDSAMSIPTGCGTPTSLKSTDLKQAMLFYDSCNAAMFVRNPKTNTWVELAAGGSVVYVDSLYTMPDSAKLFYTKNSIVYSIDLVAALSGGDSSIFEQIIDTTNIESFAIPYADTSGRFKADSALRFQPSTKTVITNNLYLYGTTASQPGKLWLKQASPSGGQRPVIYSGLIPEEFGNGAIHFSGGGGNAVMEINSGDNNDLLLHSPDGSLLFKQTDGLYRYYYLPSNTSTRKVLVTDDSGYVAWNVIDSLVSSLGAGNGIDITNGIVKLDDTLRTDTRFIAHADSGITNLELLGLGTGGLSAQGLKIYPHLGLLHLYAYEPGAGGSLFMYGNGEVTLIGKPLHLNADSIYLDKPGGGPYGPTATDISKYKVQLMDKTTGAMATVAIDSVRGMTSPMNSVGDLIRGGTGGTPTRIAAGTDGYVLTMNTGIPTWMAASSGGVTGVGTFSGSSQTNGASISASTITFGPADATNPGMVSTGPQFWAGPKTFNDTMTVINGSRITFGSSAGNPGFAASKRIVFDYNGSETYDIRTQNAFRMVLNVPANREIAFHSGDYSGSANIGTFSSSAISFSAPIGGNISSLTSTTTGTTTTLISGTNGGANAFGIGAIKGGGTTFTNTIFWPSSGRLEFSRSGTSLASIVGIWDNNGLSLSSSIQTTGSFSTPASSLLNLSSTTQGFLKPRMTTTQMNAISSPATGLEVYNTTTSQPNYRDGSTWQAQVGMTFGTAAPTSTPTAVGNFFLDTTNKKLYVATGTASSADWNILN